MKGFETGLEFRSVDTRQILGRYVKGVYLKCEVYTKLKKDIQLDATLKEQWYLVTVVQLTTETAAAVRGHVCRGVCGVDPSVTVPVLSGSGHHNSKAFTKLQSDPAERTQICASLNITAPLASVSVGKSHKHTACSAFKQAFK